MSQKKLANGIPFFHAVAVEERGIGHVGASGLCYINRDTGHSPKTGWRLLFQHLSGVTVALADYVKKSTA
jgi:hypothetical protein